MIAGVWLSLTFNYKIFNPSRICSVILCLMMLVKKSQWLWNLESVLSFLIHCTHTELQLHFAKVERLEIDLTWHLAGFTALSQLFAVHMCGLHYTYATCRGIIYMQDIQVCHFICFSHWWPWLCMVNVNLFQHLPYYTVMKHIWPETYVQDFKDCGNNMRSDGQGLGRF